VLKIIERLVFSIAAHDPFLFRNQSTT